MKRRILLTGQPYILLDLILVEATKKVVSMDETNFLRDDVAGEHAGRSSIMPARV